MKIWSLYQKAIFSFIKNGSGNAIIESAPGSGKTTTLVECLNYIPPASRKNSLFLAFNSKIVEELKTRVPKGIKCNTFHQFCLHILRSKNPKIKIDSRGVKIKNIVTGLVGAGDDEENTRNSLIETVSLAKAYLANDVKSVEMIIAKHQIATDRIDFAQLVVRALDLSVIQNQIVDFDDMIYFISRFNLDLPEYEFVLIDEGQDSNPARIDICRRLLSSRTRMFVAGDKYQAILQYCGACEDSMEQLQRMMNAKVFPLTVSYRCAKRIIAEAKKYVSTVESAPTAVDGLVTTASYNKMIEEAEPGDYILSRVNAPLIRIAFKLLLKGKRCNIVGRDLGRTLNWTIRCSKTETVIGFLSWLNVWKIESLEKISKGTDPSYIYDRVACFEVLCAGAHNLSTVRKRIKHLFEERDKKNPGLDKIRLSSIHRAKGSESERVWLLNKGLKPGQSNEENNIIFVGITRAKKELYFVEAAQ